MTPEDTDLVRRLRDMTNLLPADPRPSLAAEAIERLSAEKDAAEADADRLIWAATEGPVGEWDKALATHAARRGRPEP